MFYRLHAKRFYNKCRKAGLIVELYADNQLPKNTIEVEVWGKDIDLHVYFTKFAINVFRYLDLDERPEELDFLSVKEFNTYIKNILDKDKEIRNDNCNCSH